MTINTTVGSGGGGGSQVIAGDGLTGGGVISSDVTLNVGAGSGITVTANAVAVDATVARSTWAVTAGAGLTGGGTLASGGVNLDVGAGTGITVNANDVAINQAFTPTWTGAHIWSTTATFNGAATFNSTAAFAGGIASSLIPSVTDTYDLGSSTKLWNKGWLSELDAVLFAQNVVTVIGGWLMVSKGEGTLGADLGSAVGDTTANLGTTAGILAHATTGDIILLRAAGAVEYLKVTAGSGPTWTVTRDLDGSGRNAWPAGSVFVNLGYNGTGRIELNANSTPRISILRQGTTYNAQTELVRIGDLNGWGGFVAEEYGWAVGDYAGGNYAFYGASGGFKVAAGGGALTLDANGLRLAKGTSGPNSIQWWKTAGSAYTAAVYAGGTTSLSMLLDLDGKSDYSPDLEAEISLRVAGLTGTYQFFMNSDTTVYGYPFYMNGGLKVNTLESATHIPSSAGSSDLGSTALEWGDLYLTTNIYFGAGQDVRLYRSAADVLRTPDALTVDGAANFGVATGAGAGGDAAFKRSGGSEFTIQTPSSQVRAFADSGNQLWLGAGGTADLIRIGTTGALMIPDGITAPGTTSGKATIYVDTADGDLKVKFGDGTVKTIVVDT